MAIPITNGLILHLKADEITGLNDGDRISQWDDDSGESNDATASGDRRPIYRTSSSQEGGAAVDFGTSNHLAVPSGVFNIRGGTTFVVGKSNGNGDRAYYISKPLSTDSSRWYIKHIDEDPITTLRFRVGGATSDVTADGGWSVIALSADGNTKKGYIDGEEKTSFSDSNNDTAGVSYIGNFHDTETQGTNGYICEVVHYNRALSNSEIDDVTLYLGKKWLGWATDTNSEKDIELTGQSEDNSERNIELSGGISENSEKNIELEGTTNVWWIERQIDGGEWTSLQEEIQIDPDGNEYTYTDEYEFVIGTQYCYRVKNAYGYVSSILLSTLQVGSDIKLTWSYE